MHHSALGQALPQQALATRAGKEALEKPGAERRGVSGLCSASNSLWGTESVAAAWLVVGGTLFALPLGNVGLTEEHWAWSPLPDSPVMGAGMLPSQGLGIPFCKWAPWNEGSRETPVRGGTVGAVSSEGYLGSCVKSGVPWELCEVRRSGSSQPLSPRQAHKSGYPQPSLLSQMSWSSVCLRLISAAPQKTCTWPPGPLLGLPRLPLPLCPGR